MTNAVATVDEEIYDPDNPPEDRGFLGKLTITAHVDGTTVTPSYGELDARIVEQCGKYAAKANNYTGPLWYLEADGIDVVRSDGEPFRQRDIVKLKTAKGANLGAKQSPDLLAQAYRAVGVTASYTKTTAADTAIGRTFQFANKDLKLGGGFTKPVRLFPKEIKPEGFIFEGEARVITPRAADDAAPTDGGTSSAPAESEVIATLQRVLAGKTPADMMQAVIDEPSLQSVATVFGVPLLESATDETLVAVLVENKAMTVKDNILHAVPA